MLREGREWRSIGGAVGNRLKGWGGGLGGRGLISRGAMLLSWGRWVGRAVHLCTGCVCECVCALLKVPVQPGGLPTP